MKITYVISATLALCFLASGNIYSETVHQTATIESALSGEGAKATDKKLIETKDLSSGEKIGRCVGSMPQWGFVNFWFGIPVPAGKATLRLKVYVDDTEPGSYALYVTQPGGDPLIKKLEIPADAKKNAFVTIDVPVDVAKEWNGLALKKIAASDKPGPWIESIQAVLP
jgi:hypothetical protein